MKPERERTQTEDRFLCDCEKLKASIDTDRRKFELLFEPYKYLLVKSKVKKINK